MRLFLAIYIRRILTVGFLLSIAGGCSGENLLVVKGKVINGSHQLNHGTVTFHPDSKKGNKNRKTGMGEIKEDGQYTIFTGNNAGLAPGWYKVTVVAAQPVSTDTDGEKMYAVPKYIVAQKYMQEKTTPLYVEVKANAPSGNYDLQLVKK